MNFYKTKKADKIAYTSVKIEISKNRSKGWHKTCNVNDSQEEKLTSKFLRRKYILPFFCEKLSLNDTSGGTIMEKRLH